MDVAKYRRLFLDESREHLGLLGRELLRLEQEGGGVDALFRAAHSIKGMAGSMGYDAIVAVAHALEDVLDLLRKGALAPAPALMPPLFEAVDEIGALLAEVEEQGRTRRDARTGRRCRASTCCTRRGQPGCSPRERLRRCAGCANARREHGAGRGSASRRRRAQPHHVDGRQPERR